MATKKVASTSEEVVAPSGEKITVQVVPALPADPGAQLVEVIEDVAEELVFPNSTRTGGQKMIAPQGYITTRRQADEMGLKSSQYKEIK